MRCIAEAEIIAVIAEEIIKLLVKHGYSAGGRRITIMNRFFHFFLYGQGNLSPLPFNNWNYRVIIPIAQTFVQDFLEGLLFRISAVLAAGLKTGNIQTHHRNNRPVRNIRDTPLLPRPVAAVPKLQAVVLHQQHRS